MFTVEISVGDVTLITDPTVVEVLDVAFADNGFPTATVVD